MKKFFIAIVALAAAVSCSNDDIISIDRQAIGFGNPFVNNSVRADYSSSMIDQFKVYGTVTGNGNTIALYNGANVTRGDAAYGAPWTCTQTEYWIPNCTYAFQAVVDGEITTKDGKQVIEYTVGQNKGTDSISDLLYATAEATTNGEATPTGNIQNGCVAFTFEHLLSKVHFTVTSNATGGYYHTVTGIKVSNFESGTYTIADGTWAGGTAKEVAFANIENVESTDTDGVSNADLLLVPNAATFDVTFTVDLYKNGTKLGTETKTIAVENDLVKGNSYNFTIACSVGNPIKFTVTNDPAWADPTTDVTVQ